VGTWEHNKSRSVDRWVTSINLSGIMWWCTQSLLVNLALYLSSGGKDFSRSSGDNMAQSICSSGYNLEKDLSYGGNLGNIIHLSGMGGNVGKHNFFRRVLVSIWKPVRKQQAIASIFSRQPRVGSRFLSPSLGFNQPGFSSTSPVCFCFFLLARSSQPSKVPKPAI
jgi:hypothetical protein